MRWRNHSHCATANSHHCHGHRRRRHHRRRRRRCLCGHRHRLLLRAMKKTWTWTIHLCRHHQYQLYRRFLPRHPPSPSQSWWRRLQHPTRSYHRRLCWRRPSLRWLCSLLPYLLAGLATRRDGSSCRRMRPIPEALLLVARRRVRRQRTRRRRRQRDADADEAAAVVADEQ